MFHIIKHLSVLFNMLLCHFSWKLNFRVPSVLVIEISKSWTELCMGRIEGGSGRENGIVVVFIGIHFIVS